MVGLLFLNFKIGYRSLVIFLSVNKNDDLILYLRSEEEHALDL